MSTYADGVLIYLYPQSGPSFVSFFPLNIILSEGREPEENPTVLLPLIFMIYCPRLPRLSDRRRSLGRTLAQERSRYGPFRRSFALSFRIEITRAFPPNNTNNGRKREMLRCK